MEATHKLAFEGAVYALEQCSILMRDAVRLFDLGSTSTASVLALLGREELGKYLLLRNAFSDVAAAEAINIKELWGECLNHKIKQDEAATSVVAEFNANDRSRESELQKVMVEETQKSIEQGTPVSDRYKTAHKEMQGLMDKRRKEYRNERHLFRMSAQYVDLIQNHSEWQRPCEISNEDAKRELEHALSDFFVEYRHLVLGKERSNAFLDAFNNWEERPVIQEPIWPKKPSAAG